MGMIGLFGNLAAISLAGTAPAPAPAQAELPRHTHPSAVSYRLPETREAQPNAERGKAEVKVPMESGDDEEGFAARRRPLPALELAEGSARIRMRANGLRFNWEF